jgi:hypothetical protein
MNKILCRILQYWGYLNYTQFVEPFCFHRDIKKAIVIYFTLMRFVNKLFALLSGLSKDVVPGYLEQSF